MEKEIEKVITGLADAFEKENKQNYIDNFADKLSNLSFEKLSNWELFGYELKSPLDQHIKMWYATKYPELSPKILNEISFFYLHFDFLEHNVEHLVDLERGCCVDKAKYILKTYLDYLITNNIPKYNNRQDSDHNYWEPDFGTSEEWFDFVNSLQYLYYGKPEKYVASYEVLALQKKAVLKQVEDNEKIANNFVKEYVKCLERNKDVLSDKVYEAMNKRYLYGSVIFPLLDNIKDGSINDEIIVNKVKEIYEKNYKE